MAELRSLLEDSVGLGTRFPGDHSRSHSVHPQPCALADYPRSLFGFPCFTFKGRVYLFRYTRIVQLVPSPGLEPGCREDTAF